MAKVTTACKLTRDTIAKQAVDRQQWRSLVEGMSELEIVHCGGVPVAVPDGNVDSLV